MSLTLPEPPLGRCSLYMPPMQSSATSPDVQEEVCDAILHPRLRFPGDRLISALNQCGQVGTMESVKTRSEGPDSRIPLFIPCGGECLHFEQIIRTKKRWGKSDFFFLKICSINCDPKHQSRCQADLFS